MLGALLIALVAAVVAVLAWRELQRPLDAPVERVEIRVAPGSSARAIAHTLRAAGIDVHVESFVAAARAANVTKSLRAGRYAIERGMTLEALIDKLGHGDVLKEHLTIVEGWAWRDMRRALAAQPDLRHDSDRMNDATLMQAIGAPDLPPEGLFAPDTYAFDAGASDLDVLRQAYRAQAARLEQAWQTRVPDLPFKTPYEALIMASIVEKETGLPDERRRIAGVFINRQRRGMLLQTDPTVIYGLGERFDGNLRKRDLLADGPYNTYTRVGLPPTPIALPGRAAIAAALDPEPTRALYFVARGDGSSEFSESLADHNRAVDRYQRAGAPAR
jgi:UPF0755 protein